MKFAGRIALPSREKRADWADEMFANKEKKRLGY